MQIVSCRLEDWEICVFFWCLYVSFYIHPRDFYCLDENPYFLSNNKHVLLRLKGCLKSHRGQCITRQTYTVLWFHMDTTCLKVFYITIINLWGCFSQCSAKYYTSWLLKTINAQSPVFIFFVTNTFVTDNFRPILLHILHDMFHSNN